MGRPIVKWIGGKTRLLPELRARLPQTFGRYFEPFCGGAALALDLAPAKLTLGDANADLIAMYRAVADDVEDVIGLLEHLAVDHSEERYYEIRGEWNARAWAADETAQAAAFLYLVRACFNGLWRVNGAGAMNAAIGRDSAGRLYTADRIHQPDNLRAASQILQRAELVSGDYRDMVRDAGPGDVVFFDPPYDPIAKTANYTAYTADGFGPDDQRALAVCVRDLTARGVHVLVSNSDTPLIREIYDGMQIDVVQCDRRVAAKAGSRGKVNEVIVTAYPSVYRSAPRRPAKRAAAPVPAGQLSLGGLDA